MRISDWSSDVCSSDLGLVVASEQLRKLARAPGIVLALALHHVAVGLAGLRVGAVRLIALAVLAVQRGRRLAAVVAVGLAAGVVLVRLVLLLLVRSEAHTSELQSLMRISYAVFCLKKKN